MPKKYSVNMDGNRVVSVEVDGVRYTDAERIPNRRDRETVRLLLAGTADDLALSEITGQPSRFEKTLFGVFLSVTLLMLAICVYTTIRTVQALAQEQSLPGQVVSLVTRQTSDGSTYAYPVVQFVLPNRQVTSLEMGEGSWPPAYEQGQAVTVQYNPGNPNGAYLRSFSSTLTNWTLPGITGIIGVAFSAATLFVRWVFKPANPA